MLYRSQTSLNADYVTITATGEYSQREMFEFISHCRAEAGANERERVLIDCSELKIKISEVERFEGGQMFARLFGPDFKVALILPAEQITKMGEMAANNRGGRLLVTPSHDEAIAWVLDL
jgi:hypothetical protein